MKKKLVERLERIAREESNTILYRIAASNFRRIFRQLNAYKQL